jgi:hypothetical protein
MNILFNSFIRRRLVCIIACPPLDESEMFSSARAVVRPVRPMFRVVARGAWSRRRSVTWIRRYRVALVSHAENCSRPLPPCEAWEPSHAMGAGRNLGTTASMFVTSGYCWLFSHGRLTACFALAQHRRESTNGRTLRTHGHQSHRVHQRGFRHHGLADGLGVRGVLSFSAVLSVLLSASSSGDLVSSGCSSWDVASSPARLPSACRACSRPGCGSLAQMPER